MAVKLSKRLVTIADMVDSDAYIADIGADHGHLPIFLVQSGRIHHAIAVENKNGPYEHLRANVARYKLEEHISTSLSDGISKLDPNVDTLILAGMGGLLSIDILSAHLENLEHIDTIILDPHKDVKRIREFVSSIGFVIIDEEMVLEDRIYYSIIKFRRGELKSPYTEDELRFGPKILEKLGDTFLSYLEKEKKRVSSLLDTNLDAASRDKYQAELEAINRQLARY